MASINEHIVLEYFFEKQKNITTDDIFERFSGFKTDDVSKILKYLEIISLIRYNDEDETWEISEKGKFQIKDEQERQSREEEFKILELEKTKLDLELAKKMLEDYPNTKSKANWGLIVAGVVALIELIRFFGFLSGRD